MTKFTPSVSGTGGHQPGCFTTFIIPQKGIIFPYNIKILFKNVTKQPVPVFVNFAEW